MESVSMTFGTHKIISAQLHLTAAATQLLKLLLSGRFLIVGQLHLIGSCCGLFGTHAK
jgi:hypothetical protein